MFSIKIGLDAFPLCKLNGGIGFYVFPLLDELIKLKKEWQFVLYAPTDEGDIEYFKSYKNVQIRKVKRPLLGHSFWSLVNVPFLLWKDQIDIYWGTTQSLPLFKRKKMKTLLLLHDFAFSLYPKTVSSFKGLYLRVFSKIFFKTADAIVSNSLATGKRLEEKYKVPFQCAITPPIKSSISFKKKETVLPLLKAQGIQYNNYVVTVGTIEPRKNLSTLIEKYIQILEENPLEKILPLVIIGGGGWKNKEIKNLLFKAQQKFPSHIKLLGFVPDSDLAFYLSGAKYYVTLSLYEGYGMPLAESRICQTPVVCFDLPEMKEAAENDGVFLNKKKFILELKAIFLSVDKESEKKGIEVNYPTPLESASKLLEVFCQLQKRSFP